LLTLFVFLDQSGYELVGADAELVGRQVSEDDSEVLIDSEIDKMILDVVEDRLTHRELVKWFRVRIRRLRPNQ
jgi:hypothetical protein